jgi:hypothetical protein
MYVLYYQVVEKAGEEVADLIEVYVVAFELTGESFDANDLMRGCGLESFPET